MIILMDKHAIIKLKQEDHSNRKVAEMLHINRKTVARYWNEYKEQIELLANDNANIKAVQEEICSAPTYDASKRRNHKYTEEMDMFLDEILVNAESSGIKDFEDVANTYRRWYKEILSAFKYM